MAEKKYDGVVEAVHYRPDGQVDWVRAYLRRGAAWSDRVLVKRDDLIKEIKSGKRFMAGQRVEFMAGTFTVSNPIQVSGASGNEVLAISSTTSTNDLLDGVPVI
jgi:hypothetical protein